MGSLVEGEHDIKLVADLPGAISDDIDLTIVGRVLTLKAAPSLSLHGGASKRESAVCAHKSLFHSFYLPQTADTSLASTKLKDGVLTVTIPKIPELPPATKKLRILCE